MASSFDDFDVRLDSTPAERDHYEQLADLYSIIVATDLLEKAFTRDACTPDDYTTACQRLLTQFQIIKNAITTDDYSVAMFLNEYQINFKAGIDRLNLGIPATMERQIHRPDKPLPLVVAEVTQFFITAMDALKLNIDSVDSILPLIKDIVEGLAKFPSLPPDFEGKVVCSKWLKMLSQLKATHVLSEDDRRQLSMELEGAYSSFYKYLSQ